MWTDIGILSGIATRGMTVTGLAHRTRVQAGTLRATREACIIKDIGMGITGGPSMTTNGIETISGGITATKTGTN
jgi:hypothetical protein